LNDKEIIMKQKSFSGLILTIILMLSQLTAVSQNSKVAWYSFNMGFAESKSSNTMVKSAVGQNFVGTAVLTNTQIASGFLADTLFRAIIVAVKPEADLPLNYALSQNYPNPFNPNTTIHFELPKESQVTLKLYNVLGQEVLTVLDEQRVAGKYDVHIDASSLSSGVYFYRLVSKDFVSTRKLTLLR